jgi:hypothetical protein
VKPRFTATIYIDQGEVAHKTGEDVDELYNWMLITTEGKFGNLHGEIVDNKTHKVVRSFRKSPPD